MAIDFTTARIPPIHCGVGSIKHLTPWLLTNQATAVLLVTGAHSLEKSGKLAELQQLIEMAGCQLEQLRCTGEPTAELVDQTTQIWSNHPFDAVIAVGGGSVIDLGKALAAMLPHGSRHGSSRGVGKGLAHSGHTLPYLAIPTTSGTGEKFPKMPCSQAVGVMDSRSPAARQFCTECGHFGWRSLNQHPSSRHSSVRDGCIHAIAGILLVSNRISPQRCHCLERFRTLDSQLPQGLQRRSTESGCTTQHGLCSLCSGIGLANAGLGIVHGMAGPIGGWYPIPMV